MDTRVSLEWLQGSAIAQAVSRPGGQIGTEIGFLQVLQFSLLVLFHLGSPYSYIYHLGQGWANYGPRAKYGPLRGSMRPAEGLENAKKMSFRKTFENHVHVCFLIFVRTSFFQHEASKKQR
jgi:hypothetical protein